MNINIFWDITPSTDVSEESPLALVFTLVSCSTYASTLKIEVICSSETSSIFNVLYGVISQRTGLFITTAERTSNPTGKQEYLQEESPNAENFALY
jgi:hypothetical protein